MKYVLMILLGVPFVFIGMIIFFNHELIDGGDCPYNRGMKQYERMGVVKEKKLNNINGGGESLILSNRAVFAWEDHYYGQEGKAFYDLVDIGDSISKATDTLILEVHKPDTIIYIDVSLKCDEEKEQ